MKIGIYTNILKDKDLSVTAKLQKVLTKNGIDCLQLSNSLPIGELPEMDVLAVVGGDGTILSITTQSAQKNIPILGVNLGNIGFLSEIEAGELDDKIAMLISGKFSVESRSMLKICTEDFSAYALNEAFIGRLEPKMITLDVYVGDHYIDKYVCDGLVVNTPTGSTAYSLSAGGPILAPTLDAICLTPVCPHSLHSRPIVLSSNDTIRVRVGESFAKALLVVDGAAEQPCRGGQDIIIKQANFSAKFIRFGHTSFYNKLLKKLNKWSTTREEN